MTKVCLGRHWQPRYTLTKKLVGEQVEIQALNSRDTTEVDSEPLACRLLGCLCDGSQMREIIRPGEIISAISFVALMVNSVNKHGFFFFS